MSFIMLGVHQLRDDLSGMAARVEVVRVCQRFALTPLFTTMSGENMLVVVVNEMLVIVNGMVRHSSWLFKIGRAHV